MSQGIDGDSGGEIEVFAVFHIPQPTALSLYEHRWWARIGGYHVGDVFIDEGSRSGISRRIGIGKSSGFLLMSVSPLELCKKRTDISVFAESERLEVAVACEAKFLVESGNALRGLNAKTARLVDIRNAAIVVFIYDDRLRSVSESVKGRKAVHNEAKVFDDNLIDCW